MIYLDNAATSWPKPEKVYRAMDTFFRNWAPIPGGQGSGWRLKQRKSSGKPEFF